MSPLTKGILISLSLFRQNQTEAYLIIGHFDVVSESNDLITITRVIWAVVRFDRDELLGLLNAQPTSKCIAVDLAPNGPITFSSRRCHVQRKEPLGRKSEERELGLEVLLPQPTPLLDRFAYELDPPLAIGNHLELQGQYGVRKD